MRYVGNAKGLKDKLAKWKDFSFKKVNDYYVFESVDLSNIFEWFEMTGTITIKKGFSDQDIKSISGALDEFKGDDEVNVPLGLDNYLGGLYTDSDVVIGIVGAFGSRIPVLIEIIKSYLVDRFLYEVKEVKVSPIIEKEMDFCPESYLGAFDRAEKLMNGGNSLRRKYRDNSFLVLRAVEEIKKIRGEQKNSKRTVYLISSLKHDDEIKRLRQIYGHGFFQISLFEDSKRRLEYLTKHRGFSESDANKLILRDESEDESHGQHTREAFHMADYFLKFEGSIDQLSNSVFRFLRLIFGDPFVTPIFNEFATFMAFSSALRSADLSRQVGAVVAKDNTIIATGANDIPKQGGGLYWPYFDEKSGEIRDFEDGRDYMRGFDSNVVEKNKLCEDLEQRILEEIFVDSNVSLDEILIKEKIKKAVRSSNIRHITEYGRVVHAEMEAILACGRERASTKGAVLYATTFPCHNCAKHIIASGIKKVIFVEPYPKSKALDFHRESISVGFDENDGKVVFEPFVGVGARSFLNLFSMSQGTGYSLERKNKSGETKSWSPHTAQLRTALIPKSHLELEDEVVKKLAEMRSREI